MKYLLFLATVVASAQPLRVFSEFVRFDKAGDPVAPAQPREILSPALVRNGFTSFQISIQGPPGVRWTLYVGLNPEDAVKITLYRPVGDRLELVEQPVQGEGVQIVWMDVWTDRAAPVRRIKVEPQLMVGEDWVIYPMEGRVMDAVVPDAKRTEASDVRTLMCGPVRRYANYVNAEQPFQSRNWRQDALLATLAPKEELLRVIGGCDPRAPVDATETKNLESYMRIRDYLFRLR
jgi:hypothetical protein